MKLFLTFVSSLVLANALTYFPQPERLRRDVNELQMILAPELEQANAEAHLADQGYKYKTLRTLRFRKRRDVSHINLDYLSPATSAIEKHPSTSYLPPADQPSHEYLPPGAEVKEVEITEPQEHEQEIVTKVFTGPSKEYLPPAAEIKESEFITELPQQPSNEYLPPASQTKEAEGIAEVQQAPSNEYLPPVSKGEDISILPLETFSKSTEEDERETEAPKESSAEIEETPNEVHQDTAVLESDGYYYKVPESTPEFLFHPTLKIINI